VPCHRTRHYTRLLLTNGTYNRVADHTAPSSVRPVITPFCTVPV